MKKVIILTVLLITTLSINAQNLLIQPQKIIIDSMHNRYLVSNYGGGGDLVAIDNLGNQSYFVENAGMIDALAIVDDTIYGTALGGRIKGYSLETGSLVMDLNLSDEGVSLLTGLVAVNSGNIIATERFGDRVFKINPATRDFWVFAEGNGIDRPNGLLYEPEFNRILVCLDKPNPPVLAVNLTDSTVYTMANTSLAGSDGIAKDLENNYYIAGYELPGIYKFDPNFSSEPELFYEDDYIIYPTFNSLNNSLLITLYWQNDWAEIFLTPSAIVSQELYNSNIVLENYPNPFNDKTTIHFQIYNQTRIKLEVYDPYGNLVNILMDEMKDYGNHSASWDGKNSKGRRVADGTYFIRLTSNQGLQNKPIVLIK
ncbi:FlgD immunoglobulin-like domain containing protein [Lentimicrobium sp. S6]|uniref:FlgD immunoglobulin-like domain containing protein n=1 Tax=Lentimicrobium sp. S6 TaxID=2735872 RepID=UPI0015538F5C|nr:FlgD immunoglobulin-like domain containing protein [Lentimicrobium sp. S6]NPD47350.1 T9SS type A sorting domain-containing protein [Lentimicrobium sp. S6]